MSLKNLIKKYDLDQPVAVELQQDVAGMEKQYKKILKATGQFSVITGFFISLYFLIKKIGIPLSFLKMSVVVVTVSSISFATYHTVSKIYAPQVSKPTIQIVDQNDNQLDLNLDAVDNKKSSTNVETSKKAVVAVKKRSLSIKPFVSKSLDKDILSVVTGTIAGEIKKAKKASLLSVDITNQLGRNGYALFGSVENVENSIVLVVKIVDVKTSKMIYIDDQKVSSLSELRGACKSMARKIMKHLH